MTQPVSAKLLTSSTKKGFNPNIGINALFDYTNTQGDSENDGFSLSEVELQFSADIDAYFRGEATIAIHKEHEEHEEGDEDTEEHAHGHVSYAVEPEEVFVETIAIPSLTFKIGKFFLDTGKFNTTHSHARMFVTRSQLENTIIGDEGLSEVGLSASYLIPTRNFNELSLQIFSPKNGEVFDEGEGHDLGYNLRYKSLFEITDSSTFDFGLSFLTAKTGHEEEKTEIMGADFTYKFSAIDSSKKTNFALVSEYLKKKSAHSETDGLSAALKYQVSSRTFVQYRYETFGLSDDSFSQGNVDTVLFAFVPSEFSSIRLQYDDNRHLEEKKITLQLNISMGAHPAHSY